MSKKILRRSLALGALMAFVITGSAMAAETVKNIPIGNGEFGYSEQSGLDANGGNDILLKGSLDADGNGKEKITFDITPVPDVNMVVVRAYGAGSVATIKDIDTIIIKGKVTSKDSSTGYSGNVFNAMSGSEIKLENIGTIKTESFEQGMVFHAIGGSRVEVNARNIDINVADNAIAAQTNGTVVLNSENISFDTNGASSIYANGGKVNITATNKLYISNESGKIMSLNGASEVTLDAKHTVLVGNINSPSKSKVDVEFKSTDSSFDGIVNTANEANTTLKFSAGTWNLKGASTISNVTFGADSVLNIDGATYLNNNDSNGTYALTAAGTEKTLTVVNGAKLKIEGIAKGNKYNIAKGFGVAKEVGENWTIDNNLLTGEWAVVGDGLQVTTVNKDAKDIVADMNVSSSTAQSLANVTAAAQSANVEGKADGTGDEKAVALVNAIANAPSEVAGQVFESVSKMAEAGGNSATAASIVKNVTGVTNDRLSFNCGHSAPHKGGHGVGLFEEGSGADVWVEYVHGKDEVEDMPSTAGKTSYEGQYNGIVMGVDFKKVNKFQSGIAFNYGEGDTNSVGSAARTHSDYDFWGIGYYGSIHNDDSNVIFDIGYAKTDSDVENTNELGVNFKASPETTTWTAGVKLEKLYQNENVQIVPYSGLRFMSIDPDDYSTECASASYKMERQNVWLLPLGVSIKQEVTNDNGWTVSPRVDLSYIWAFGDTDSEMEFSTLGTKTNIGYEVMDDGSFLGLVGIEAHKGQWGFGVSYSYQKGDYSTSKKWFIDANYSF